MTPDDLEKMYADFEKRGVLAVRHDFLSGNLSEANIIRARAWLEIKDHEEESSRSAANIELIREANALASRANDLAATATAAAEDSAASARRSASAAEASNDLARKSNTIATIALIAAVVAMAISIIGIFVK